MTRHFYRGISCKGLWSATAVHLLLLAHGGIKWSVRVYTNYSSLPSSHAHARCGAQLGWQQLGLEAMGETRNTRQIAADNTAIMGVIAPTGHEPPPLSYSLSRTKKGERIRTGKDSYSKSTIMLLGSCAQLRHSTWLQAGWFTVQHKSVYGLKLRHQYGDVNTSSSVCAQRDGGAMMPCTSSDSPFPHPQLHSSLSHT